MEEIIKQESCTSCGSVLPKPFLDLGETPLANCYLNNLDELAIVFPLDVCFCPKCYLVQLGHRVNPTVLYSNYAYFSSYSDFFLKHAEEFADELVHIKGADSSTHILEIASNDGYLLQYLQAKGVKVLGIEPATNIAKVAIEKGIPTKNIFFGFESVNEIITDFGKSDYILGNNVLAHVPDINSFVIAVKACLKPDGTAIFEFPYALNMLHKVEFDTIYHEHVYYYTVLALKNLFARQEMEIYDIKFSEVHGGSIRIYVCNRNVCAIRSIVSYYELQERLAGLDSMDSYDMFAMQTVVLKDKLVHMLADLKSRGASIAAYGAAAKGNTLLNYCGITTSTIDFVVDLSPYKQGKYLPGSNIPIFASQVLLEKQPSHTLLLTWNFKEEIMLQQTEYRNKGGKFIIPIPTPKIVK